MGTASEDLNRRLLRARDAMDREYDQALDLARVASVAHLSPSHFGREFRRVFGETPHHYLQRRRIERAMAALRSTDTSVTEVCLAVGFTSLGTFSRVFREVVGSSPSSYRAAAVGAEPTSTSFVMRWGRPSVFGEAATAERALA